MVETRGQVASWSHMTREAQLATEEFQNAQRNGIRLQPGIQDEVTLKYIAPKLPWADFYLLSVLNKHWRNAIRSRTVYETRAGTRDRLKTTETAVVVKFRPNLTSFITDKIVLFSLNDSVYRELPLISFQLKVTRIPSECCCISLDGKIYILGGRAYPRQSNRLGSDRVFVLDVAAGHSEWKECAHMLHPKFNFACCVLGEKIYAFGGQPPSAEVYDPTQNTWSPIFVDGALQRRWTPVISAVVVDQRIFLFRTHSARAAFCIVIYAYGLPESAPLAIYCPATDAWNVIQPAPHGTDLPWDPVGTMFAPQGIRYALRTHHIYVAQDTGNLWSWKDLQACSFSRLERLDESKGVALYRPDLTVNGEIVGILKYYEIGRRGAKFCFVQTKGFGPDFRRTFFWEKVWCSDNLLADGSNGGTNVDTYSMCAVHF